MMIPKYLSSAELIQAQVEKASRKIEILSKSLEPLMKSGVSLETLLREENIDVPLTSDELFLMESFFAFCSQNSKTIQGFVPLLL